jgi:hypothetical protein
MFNHVRFRLWQSRPVNLPEWLAAWCREHLGAAPADVLLRDEHMSEIFGLRLTDGREVVVKARPDQNGRAATCVEVQRILAGRGFPCPPPLTGVTVHDGRAVHAEQWRPGGEVLRGDDPATGRLFGALLARMVELPGDRRIRPGQRDQDQRTGHRQCPILMIPHVPDAMTGGRPAASSEGGHLR